MTNYQAISLAEEQTPDSTKTVLAINLPESIQTLEAVTDVFYPYGDITVVLLKPENVPNGLNKWKLTIYDLGQTCCALINFETSRAAKFAVHVLTRREKKCGFKCGLLKNGLQKVLYSNTNYAVPICVDVNSSMEEKTTDDTRIWQKINSKGHTGSKILNGQNDVLSMQNKSLLLRQPRGPTACSHGFLLIRSLQQLIF